MKTFLTTLFSAAALAAAPADQVAVATGINTFGLELHRRLAAAGGGNLVTSPWSIESALAMTYGGAAGQTKSEMQSVLHLPQGGAAVPDGFAALAGELAELARKSAERVNAAKRGGGAATPLVIRTANRLFGERSYLFKKPFLDLTEKAYAAPLELVDFRKTPETARDHINRWVAGQTQDRIRELIPAGVIDRETRLVLTNAVYFKAAWAEQFKEEPGFSFRVNGGAAVKVPGLRLESMFGYHPLPGGVAVTIPYQDRGLQFVLLVPDGNTGLAALEQNLTAALLAKVAEAGQREISLHFPAFKLEPPRVRLAEVLKAMGMPSAFDDPRGSADFSGMAPRRPDDYLCLSEVVHQAFVAVDQYGTEAAAATAAVMMRATSAPSSKPEPLEIRVDRPFAFAIQHQFSGACLFLGRVTDPR